MPPKGKKRGRPRIAANPCMQEASSSHPDDGAENMWAKQADELASFLDVIDEDAVSLSLNQLQITKVAGKLTPGLSKTFADCLVMLAGCEALSIELTLDGCLKIDTHPDPDVANSTLNVYELVKKLLAYKSFALDIVQGGCRITMRWQQKTQVEDPIAVTRSLKNLSFLNNVQIDKEEFTFSLEKTSIRPRWSVENLNHGCTGAELDAKTCNIELQGSDRLPQTNHSSVHIIPISTSTPSHQPGIHEASAGGEKGSETLSLGRRTQTDTLVEDQPKLDEGAQVQLQAHQMKWTTKKDPLKVESQIVTTPPLTESTDPTCLDQPKLGGGSSTHNEKRKRKRKKELPQIATCLSEGNVKQVKKHTNLTQCSKKRSRISSQSETEGQNIAKRIELSRRTPSHQTNPLVEDQPKLGEKTKKRDKLPQITDPTPYSDQPKLCDGDAQMQLQGHINKKDPSNVITPELTPTNAPLTQCSQKRRHSSSQSGSGKKTHKEKFTKDINATSTTHGVQETESICSEKQMHKPRINPVAVIHRRSNPVVVIHRLSEEILSELAYHKKYSAALAESNSNSNSTKSAVCPVDAMKERQLPATFPLSKRIVENNPTKVPIIDPTAGEKSSKSTLKNYKIPKISKHSGEFDLGSKLWRSHDKQKTKKKIHKPKPKEVSSDDSSMKAENQPLDGTPPYIVTQLQGAIESLNIESLQGQSHISSTQHREKVLGMDFTLPRLDNSTKPLSPSGSSCTCFDNSFEYPEFDTLATEGTATVSISSLNTTETMDHVVETDHEEHDSQRDCDITLKLHTPCDETALQDKHQVDIDKEIEEGEITDDNETYQVETTQRGFTDDDGDDDDCVVVGVEDWSNITDDGVYDQGEAPPTAFSGLSTRLELAHRAPQRHIHKKKKKYKKKKHHRRARSTSDDDSYEVKRKRAELYKAISPPPPPSLTPIHVTPSATPLPSPSPTPLPSPSPTPQPSSSTPPPSQSTPVHVTPPPLLSTSSPQLATTSSATPLLPPLSATSLPPPSATSLPPPSATSLPPPSATSLPPPSATSLSPPSATSLPPPSATSLPPPSVSPPSFKTPLSPLTFATPRPPPPPPAAPPTPDPVDEMPTGTMYLKLGSKLVPIKKSKKPARATESATLPIQEDRNRWWQESQDDDVISLYAPSNASFLDDPEESEEQKLDEIDTLEIEREPPTRKCQSPSLVDRVNVPQRRMQPTRAEDRVKPRAAVAPPPLKYSEPLRDPLPPEPDSPEPPAVHPQPPLPPGAPPTQVLPPEPTTPETPPWMLNRERAPSLSSSNASPEHRRPPSLSSSNASPEHRRPPSRTSNASSASQTSNEDRQVQQSHKLEMELEEACKRENWTAAGNIFVKLVKLPKRGWCQRFGSYLMKDLDNFPTLLENILRSGEKSDDGAVRQKLAWIGAMVISATSCDSRYKDGCKIVCVLHRHKINMSDKPETLYKAADVCLKMNDHDLAFAVLEGNRWVLPKVASIRERSVRMKRLDVLNNLNLHLSRKLNADCMNLDSKSFAQLAKILKTMLLSYEHDLKSFIRRMMKLAQQRHPDNTLWLFSQVKKHRPDMFEPTDVRQVLRYLYQCSLNQSTRLNVAGHLAMEACHPQNRLRIFPTQQFADSKLPQNVVRVTVSMSQEDIHMVMHGFLEKIVENVIQMGLKLSEYEYGLTIELVGDDKLPSALRDRRQTTATAHMRIRAVLQLLQLRVDQNDIYFVIVEKQSFWGCLQSVYNCKLELTRLKFRRSPPRVESNSSSHEPPDRRHSSTPYCPSVVPQPAAAVPPTHTAPMPNQTMPNQLEIPGLMDNFQQPGTSQGLTWPQQLMRNTAAAVATDQELMPSPQSIPQRALAQLPWTSDRGRNPSDRGRNAPGARRGGGRGFAYLCRKGDI